MEAKNRWTHLSRKQGMVWGGLLIFFGVMGLLQTVADLTDWGWVALLTIAGFVVLAVFLTDTSDWTLLIPAYVMFAVAGLIALLTLGVLRDEFVATYVLSAIALPFLVVFVRDRNQSWALIPAYVLLAVGLMVGLIGLGILRDLLIPSYVMFAIAIPFFVVYARNPQAMVGADPCRGNGHNRVVLAVGRGCRPVSSAGCTDPRRHLSRGAAIHAPRIATARRFVLMDSGAPTLAGTSGLLYLHRRRYVTRRSGFSRMGCSSLAGYSGRDCGRSRGWKHGRIHAVRFLYRGSMAGPPAVVARCVYRHHGPGLASHRRGHDPDLVVVFWRSRGAAPIPAPGFRIGSDRSSRP